MSNAPIHADLLAARREFPPILKDGKNPHFGNRYVTLEQLLTLIAPALDAHDMGVRFDSTLEGEWMRVQCYLYNAVEHVCAAAYVPAGRTAQEAGSSLTYGRRYALEAVLGITGTEDDDGHTASHASEDASTGDGWMVELPEGWRDQGLDEGPFAGLTWAEVGRGEVPDSTPKQIRFALNRAYKKCHEAKDFEMLTRVVLTGRALATLEGEA